MSSIININDNIQIINDNLLNSQEDIIVHQCNCVTTSGRGLSKAIFDKFPEANVYENHNTKKSRPGTIEIREINSKQIIVAFFAQRGPGKPQLRGDDNAQIRLIWFQYCLEELTNQIKNINKKTIAMPYLIGCGLAGGNWESYFSILEEWTEKYDIKLILYDIDGKYK